MLEIIPPPPSRHPFSHRLCHIPLLVPHLNHLYSWYTLLYISHVYSFFNLLFCSLCVSLAHCCPTIKVPTNALRLSQYPDKQYVYISDVITSLLLTWKQGLDSLHTHSLAYFFSLSLTHSLTHCLTRTHLYIRTYPNMQILKRFPSLTSAAAFLNGTVANICICLSSTRKENKVQGTV